MALHPEFPKSPYTIAAHDQRWFPAAEGLRTSSYEKLLPPLVANIREAVSAWRTAGYPGTSATSRALIRWWFETTHLIEQGDGSLTSFEYYFAQREAVETIIWPYDVRGVGKLIRSTPEEKGQQIDNVATLTYHAVVEPETELKTGSGSLTA